MAEEKHTAGTSKRSCEDDSEMDNENPSKRQKLEGKTEGRLEGMHAELRLLLPSRNAGAIIGKGGENIKRLRQNFRASISVPDSRGPERILVVGGKVEQICDVLTDVIRKLEKTENKEDIECEVRMLIHQTQAGRVIGRGGCKVKELRQESGAQVKVFSECCPQSTDRVTQMNGSLSQIITCLELIFEILDVSPIRGVNVPYNPNNFDDSAAPDYGGYSEGRSRGRGGNRGDMGGRGDGFGRGDAFGRMGGHQNQGFPSFDGLAGFSGMPGIGLGRLGPNALGGLLGNMTAMMTMNSQKPTTTQVSIPKHLAGAIIGKGGSRIREVQAESGTTIKIDNESNDSNERIISITGAPDQIQYAQYLLQMTVKQHAKAF